ncbi:undecaprenyl-diphosphatase UppP [Candidatus Uhrbacteria bacterium]|nr:undecaprenyl-diphosphatase UppP [Candidatus Uhrbacteria bacterium]
MMLISDIVLGALQGLTEFLPISSSGHLVIFHELFGLISGDDLTFDAILQLGTMLALLMTFRQDIWRLTINGYKWLRGKKNPEINQDFKIILAILIGTIPAMILGVAIQSWMETVFRHSWIVAIVLILGNCLFLYAEKKATQKNNKIESYNGLLIGIFQCLALFPGMSRSGATISGGLILGLNRELAVRFSFLLSIPIITGSGLLKLIQIIKQPSHTYGSMDLLIGFLVSFTVGFFAIKWLLKFLKTNRLYPFIWYRFGLASVILIWAIVQK